MLFAAAAMLWDLITGEPKRLYDKIRHPVSWMASLLMFFEGRLNRLQYSAFTRKIFGGFSLLVCISLWGSIAFSVEKLVASSLQGHEPLKLLVMALLASIFIAARSLFDHVTTVKDALENGSLEASQRAVAKIVGRQTDTLDKTAVARAATESLAENFSDGVVAPVFWLLIGGLPGIVIYKMVNTADSMVGYKTERFGNFGWASARLDDLLNLIPARLTALLILLSGFLLRTGRVAKAAHVVVRDSGLHASPNAGWPEAAMAGMLEARLGGPRQYAAMAQKDYAWLGAEFSYQKQPDLALALRLAKLSWGWMLAGLLLGWGL